MMMSSYLIDCGEAVHEGEVERACSEGGVPKGKERWTLDQEDGAVHLFWSLAMVDYLRKEERDGGHESGRARESTLSCHIQLSIATKSVGPG